MSDSLLTRYRPASFDEVLGQDKAVASLKAAIEKKRGRAFLFTGPSGTGKTTLARIAAKQLGCAEHAVIEVDAATENGIDDMRNVQSLLQYQPMGGGSSAVIVDEFHAASKAAMTSLLKSIEEPPAWAFWFLCTTEPQKVPENIRTRCLRYDLKPVPRGDLIALLELVVEEEKMEFGQNAGPILDLCAHEAGGSPRQALANLATCAEASTRAEAAELLRSATDSTQAIELARALVQGARWPQVQQILNELGEVSPESVRHVVRAYVTKAVLGAKREDAAGRGLEILDAFSQPFHPSDGITPVVLACGRCLLS